MRFWALTFTLSISACALFQTTQDQTSMKQELRSGITTENFDHHVTPGQDFYRYVNGRWLDQTQIPEDKADYGVFTILADRSREQVRTIITDISRETSVDKDTEHQKIRDLYLSFMDLETIERKGLSALEPSFRDIDAISDLKELSRYFANAAKTGVDLPFGIQALNDFKNPDRYILFFSQSGLGLPDRDQYLKTDKDSLKLQAQYKSHIESMLRHLKIQNPSSIAKDIYQLEEYLARAQLSRTQMRQRDKIYNLQDESWMATQLAPFDWKTFAQEAGLSQGGLVVVTSPEYVKALKNGFKSKPLSLWKHYLKWHLLIGYGDSLSETIAKEHFRFHQGVLRGIQSEEERWKRGVDLVNHLLGEAIGKEYIARHFKPEAKAKMSRLVQNLKLAYEDSIKKLDWMGPETRAKALEKLAKFSTKIGHPDHWKSYEALSISPDDLVGNLMRVAAFEFNDNIRRVGQKVDRSEWLMTPQTVNAYYNPSQNEIVFPAAILQAPFFNADADDAVNYGAIGSVIGHEMGHGFDDQGSKFNGDGKLENWWTEKDLLEFQARTRKLVSQFEKFEPVKGHFLNGEFTLGENIGDLGGLSIAYKAYKLSRPKNDAPALDHFTGDQRFFIGWAQVWPRKYRKAELIRRIMTDPHSPSEFRVNGVVSNLPGFYEAFDVKEKDPMYLSPSERVKIW